MLVGFALLACAWLPGAEAEKVGRPTVGGAAPRRAKRSAKVSTSVQAVAATAVGLDVADYSYEEPDELGADAVEVEVHACALTIADVQQLRGEWGTCLLPLVPGREAVGVVMKVGNCMYVCVHRDDTLNPQGTHAAKRGTARKLGVTNSSIHFHSSGRQGRQGDRCGRPRGRCARHRDGL